MISYIPAPDIKIELVDIARKLGMRHVWLDNVVCMRSTGSKSRSCLARIWALDRIWQIALQTRAHYIVEVISERYDHLPQHEKEKVLIHELMHIPKKFSGGLRNHGGEFGKTIGNKLLEKLQRTLHEPPPQVEQFYAQETKNIHWYSQGDPGEVPFIKPLSVDEQKKAPKGLFERLQKVLRV